MIDMKIFKNHLLYDLIFWCSGIDTDVELLTWARAEVEYSAKIYGLSPELVQHKFDLSDKDSNLLFHILFDKISSVERLKEFKDYETIRKKILIFLIEDKINRM